MLCMHVIRKAGDLRRSTGANAGAGAIHGGLIMGADESLEEGLLSQEGGRDCPGAEE